MSDSDSLATTIHEFLKFGAKELLGKSDSAELDSQILLSHVLNVEVSELLKRKILYQNCDVSVEDSETYRSLITERATGKPVAYITGKREFWKYTFNVSEDVLIPRPETELIVELVLKEMSAHPEKARVLDLGTGSGCIICSIAKELIDASKISNEFFATDLSESALSIAKANADNLGLQSSITFLQGSWWSALENSDEGFDIIVSNPPYIAVGDPKVGFETSFEPYSALYAGVTGLDCYIEIAAGLKKQLKPTGKAFLEFGIGQERALKDLFLQYGCTTTFYPDLQGILRIVEVASESDPKK